MNVIRAVMPHFRTQQSGYFLNIASISGSTTAPGQAIYSASKAAVILLTEAVSARTAAAIGRKLQAVAREAEAWQTLALSTRYQD